MGAGHGKLEESPNEWKPLRIGDDGAGILVVEVPDRGGIWAPTKCYLCPVPPFDILTQAIHVVLRVSEDDREHELALGVVLEGKRGEFQILENVPIKKVDDASAIYGITRQSVWMPDDDALGLALLNTSKHLIEYGTPWRLGTEGLFKHAHDLNIGLVREGTCEFVFLRVNGEYLPVF